MTSDNVTRAGVVVPVRVDPTGRGGPTPGQARGPRWRRAAPRYYTPAEVDPRPVDQRIVEAMAGTPADAALAGWAALHWAGGRWFSGFAGDGRTPLAVPVNLRERRGMCSRDGVTWVEDWLADTDVVEIDGLLVTVPARSVTFEVRRSRRADRAIRCIDMAAADDLVSIEEVRADRVRLAGRAGVAKLDFALDWADENTWSPQEVDMRIEWRESRHDATLLTNRPIFSLDGDHLVTPDLFDPVASVAGEYDGAVHLDEGLRRKDLGRDELYRELGIEQVTMMSAAADDVMSFRQRLRAAYRRAAAKPRNPRRWTLDQPAWWVDTSTVARRRALTADERGIWLRRRAG